MKKIFTMIVLACSLSASLMAAGDDAKAFDRGVGKMNSVFIPKGYVGGGISFSYKTYDLGNSTGDVGYSMLFSMLSGLQGNMHTIGVSPAVSYFVMDNFSVGVRFDYDRTNLELNSLGSYFHSCFGTE